ncbi:hypothetical protein E2562_027806 [Oryza meyeriana var. granulata]|uniref:Uncharacterized protein n=1 Tax=Oryza meyeriana var. granulata TaxID=110450 RepID=A0A6G1DP06_9ORYZ|nr:hypothetical protein E2562_027806 [Oryza meyeriana var. granulata]
MGNCQAAEVATVLIQHPGGGRTERAYWAMSAGAVMAANPGHYVAAVITSPPAAGASSGAAAAPVKHLKLLRPDDTLLLGRVYRLVSFEEVLREFASKRHVKLSRATIKAKEEVEGETRPAKPRRRRGSGGGVAPEEYSSRSLAKSDHGLSVGRAVTILPPTVRAHNEYVLSVTEFHFACTYTVSSPNCWAPKSPMIFLFLRGKSPMI